MSILYWGTKWARFITNCRTFKFTVVFEGQKLTLKHYIVVFYLYLFYNKINKECQINEITFLNLF